MSTKVAHGMSVSSRGRQSRATRSQSGRQTDNHAIFFPPRTSRPERFRGNAHLTFPQFLQLLDECLRPAREVAVEFPELLSVAVGYDDRGKPDNLVLLRQFPVLLSHLGTLGFGTRKIELYEH